MNENCMVCQRIEKIKKGENSYFVKEMETGHICKECQPEIHFCRETEATRGEFLQE